MAEDKLLEELAELEHEQWWTWAEELMDTEDLSEDREKRWKKDFKPYDKLPEDVKDFDREWAEKVLKIVDKEDNNKQAMFKKTAIEPLNATGTGEDNPPADGGDEPLDDSLDLGGDLGGGGLGGADPLGGGGGIGDGMGEPTGLSNDFFNDLKINRTPDLEKQIEDDDGSELDFTKLT